ncbi:MAG: alpha/beta hydrolase, partial [Vicinamibacterales bacterium]
VAGPHPLLVGFHGYGENATIHFDALARTVADRDWVLVSIQALSRFYTSGDREVVACWMTREDRELVIDDNVSYVKKAVAAVRAHYDAGGPLVYAGFSQGVATAYRAAAFAGPADGLLVLAGDVPPDVQPVADRLPPTLIGRGTHDDWYTAEKERSDRAVLTAAGVFVETHVFDAAHAWTDEFAVAGGRFLDRVGQRFER